MKVSEFEAKVLQVERIKIVVRAPSTQEIGPYDFQRANSESETIGNWIDSRFTDDQKKLEFVVLNGRSEEPRRNTTLATVRGSYPQK